MPKSLSWKSMLAGALALLALLFLLALIVIFSGAYNVAATDRHETPVAWALETTRTNSVQGRAAGIRVPKMTPAMIAAGAGEYKSMCEHCHGGVGKQASEWSMGMVPNPPPLARAASEWAPEEVFWMIKHGIKMTGMPAFGDTHEDSAIWNAVAFVKAMPEMSAEQYMSYPAEHAGGGHEHPPGRPAHGD